MKIQVKQFGKILISRPAGREAALATKSSIRLGLGEKIELDFAGILSMGPSWLDEFLDILQKEYGDDTVICLPSNNSSVTYSLEIIQAQHSSQTTT